MEGFRLLRPEKDYRRSGLRSYVEGRTCAFAHGVRADTQICPYSGVKGIKRLTEKVGKHIIFYH